MSHHFLVMPFDPRQLTNEMSVFNHVTMLPIDPRQLTNEMRTYAHHVMLQLLGTTQHMYAHVMLQLLSATCVPSFFSHAF
jgi:hypothetical protein